MQDAVAGAAHPLGDRRPEEAGLPVLSRQARLSVDDAEVEVDREVGEVPFEAARPARAPSYFSLLLPSSSSSSSSSSLVPRHQTHRLDHDGLAALVNALRLDQRKLDVPDRHSRVANVQGSADDALDVGAVAAVVERARVGGKAFDEEQVRGLLELSRVIRDDAEKEEEEEEEEEEEG